MGRQSRTARRPRQTAQCSAHEFSRGPGFSRYPRVMRPFGLAGYLMSVNHYMDNRKTLVLGPFFVSSVSRWWIAWAGLRIRWSLSQFSEPPRNSEIIPPFGDGSRFSVDRNLIVTSTKCREASVQIASAPPASDNGKSGNQTISRKAGTCADRTHQYPFHTRRSAARKGGAQDSKKRILFVFPLTRPTVSCRPLAGAFRPGGQQIEGGNERHPEDIEGGVASRLKVGSHSWGIRFVEGFTVHFERRRRRT